MKHILIIGGYFNRFDSFKELNVDISLIQEKNMIHDMHYQACKDVYLIDKFEAKEVTEIASQIHSKSPVDYVFSFIEEGLYPAAYLAKELKIEGMDYDVHRLCLDKTIMRGKFKNTKFSISYLKTNSKNQAFYFFREHKRIVIKDPSGCGSENVYICNTDEEFSYAWLKTANLKNEIRLLEEFLDGREYSLETLSLNGHHNFIGATKTFLYPGHLNNCAYYRSTFVSPGLLPGKGDAVLINCLTFFSNSHIVLQ